jgi:putrescine transport system ATP-binding protein
MMFQSYALFPHMTVEANIAFGLKQEGMDSSRIAERVAEMLKLVKLEQFAKRKPHQLSGGQRQRVALARSVAKRPKVLLLDEPLGALDKKLREETQFELMDLQQKLGLTFVVVTHDQEEAMTMADRIAIIDKGEVMQVATPAEVYEAPGSRFVANFVGNVNMFEGTLTARDASGADINSESGIAIRTENAGDAQSGAKVAYAVRPEKIKVSSRPPADTARNVAEGEIFDIAYLGDMTVYYVKLGNGLMVKASSLNSARITEDPLTWNDRAWISFKPDSGVVLTR